MALMFWVQEGLGTDDGLKPLPKSLLLGTRLNQSKNGAAEGRLYDWTGKCGCAVGTDASSIHSFFFYFYFEYTYFAPFFIYTVSVYIYTHKN
jgi:hypothetical protein